MQVLYVVGFDVAVAKRAPEGTSPARVALELLSQWLGGPGESAVEAEDLLRNGDLELPLAHGSQRRSAAWEHVGGDSSWATRVERRDVAADGSEFVSRVTVGDGPAGTTVRVSMARESLAAGLTPAPLPTMHQPIIVGALSQDERLQVKVDGQVQEGRYIQVRTLDEVDLLAQALSNVRRLPILLLHTRTLEALAGAQRAASRLVGLAQVVTLDYRASRTLNDRLPELEVPYAGGLLVWADMAVPPATIDAAQANHANPDVLRAALMARIAPLSVLTRGVDEAYRRARLEVQARQTNEAAQRTAEAEVSGDAEAALAALRNELDVTRSELAWVYDENSKAEDLARAYASEVLLLRAKVEQLTLAQVYRPSDVAEAETFENAPELVVADAASLEALVQHLERVSKGRILFTTNVSASWRKASRYGTPEMMRECLLKLARVAHEVVGGLAQPRGHFDTWVRENYDLKISMQDDDMPKKFRKFTWEGTTFDRTPHVKVNDGVPPDQCGRIYFAIDKTSGRYLVDSVGLHW